MTARFVCPNCREAIPAKPDRFPLHCVCGTVHRDPAVGEWREKATREVVPMPPRKPYVEPTGPGTELKRILAMLGITDTSGCGCADMLRRMNRWGVAGCREHRQEIVDHLRAKAAERGWVFTSALPIGQLVDVAIATAEMANVNSALSSPAAPALPVADSKVLALPAACQGAAPVRRPE
jgi:hypothetical protein